MIQRRNLAQQHVAVAGAETTEDPLKRARAALAEARRAAEPFLRAVREAEKTVDAASSCVDAVRAAIRGAAPWRRPALGRALRDAAAELATARAVLEHATVDAEPHLTSVSVAGDELHEAERKVAAERLRERLNQLHRVRGPSRGRDIAPPMR